MTWINYIALIAQAASLQSRVPILHFFDGFRTSHEVSKIERIDEKTVAAMLNDEMIHAHRQRGLSPTRPVLRGSSQNPDVFFQARETVNPYYRAMPALVQQSMDQFAALTGRQYTLFDYVGDPQAERIIMLMGSGAEAAHETVDYLQRQGEKVGLIKVRLFRPFATEALLAALPETVTKIAVLDRTKEPGADGEPLYKDVVTAIAQQVGQEKSPFARMPVIIGGRYGLSSKEFTPGMIKSISPLVFMMMLHIPV